MLKALTLSTAMTVLAFPALAGMKIYDFQGFAAIEAQNSVHVIVTAGPEFAIHADAESKALDQLKIDVVDGALSISRDAPWGFGNTQTQDAVRVFVTLPNLEWLGASSGAEISVSGGHGADLTLFAASHARISMRDVVYSLIDADVRNGADVHLSGQCGTLTGESHSSAVLDAVMMLCAHAKTVATSGGVVALHSSLAHQEPLDDIWDEDADLDGVFAQNGRSRQIVGLHY